jgi:hypothetical protein
VRRESAVRGDCQTRVEVDAPDRDPHTPLRRKVTLALDRGHVHLDEAALRAPRRPAVDRRGVPDLDAVLGLALEPRRDRADDGRAGPSGRRSASSCAAAISSMAGYVNAGWSSGCTRAAS